MGYFKQYAISHHVLEYGDGMDRRHNVTVVLVMEWHYTATEGHPTEGILQKGSVFVLVYSIQYTNQAAHVTTGPCCYS